MNISLAGIKGFLFFTGAKNFQIKNCVLLIKKDVTLPSGRLEPSFPDKQLTGKIFEAGKILDTASLSN